MSRILIVEDDKRIRSSMRLALEDEGYAVDDVASGEEAVAHFNDEPFELALIDLMLPGMDGFETCRTLRRQSTVPIIMVTARSDTHDVVAGLEAGADDYVTKPFVAKELAARIRALLRRSRPDDAGELGHQLRRRRDRARRRGGQAGRRGGPLHPHRVPAPQRAGRAPGQGPQPRAPARAGLGLRLLRRRTPGRRPCPQAPHQDRGRPGQSPVHPHRAGHGLQAGGLNGGPGRVPRRAGRRPVLAAGPGATRLSEGLGLRARVTATFAIGAFALSTLMAGITYFTARQSYLNERQGADQRQTFANALLVQNALRSPATQPDQLIGSAGPLPGSYSVLHSRGHWYATSISVGQSALPGGLQTLVLAARRPPRSCRWAGRPSWPSASRCRRCTPPTSSSSRWTSWRAPCARWPSPWRRRRWSPRWPGPPLGRWASGRALRPLAGVTEAAVAVAGGELDTRVEAGDDVDLQELASAFNRMTANLQDRIEREARFTSDVSHELRSPLTTLTATVGVLEAHRDELSPRARSALDLLDGDLHRFTRMVDDLLEISRFDAGSAELSLDEVDPGELVRRAVAASAPVGAGRSPVGPGFPVEVGPGVEGLRLRVDKRRFERVMANLVENATLYAGGVTRVVVERHPPVQGDAGPGPDHPGHRGGPGTGDPPRASGTTSSSASTAAAGPASGRRARAPASACPWWPSTSASTAGRSGSRTPPRAAPGSSWNCRCPPADDGLGS